MKLGERDQRRMDQKYKLGERGMLYVSDMLKQKITAGGIKIKRYGTMNAVSNSIKTLCLEQTRGCSMMNWIGLRTEWRE